MSAVHTPGPWRLSGKATVRVGDAWIARVLWYNQANNARLIAAAPDLLTALKDLLAEVHFESSSTRDARAAIANAEGKAP